MEEVKTVEPKVGIEPSVAEQVEAIEIVVEEIDV
jgi:hypothetical protein